MKPAAVLLLAATLLFTACGDAAPPTTSTPDATSSTNPPRCDYYDLDGCALYGLVLAEPRPTAAALAAVAGLPGVAIAVWRNDLVCVLEVNGGAPGPIPTVPSRFAYVDAEGIRERRLATSGSVAPPITGMHISESYWDHWEDQWAQVQQEGVLVEAVAVYLPSELVADGPPAGFRAIVRLPWRRTDTIDPSYTGELLLETEDFPAGYLSGPAALTCE